MDSNHGRAYSGTRSRWLIGLGLLLAFGLPELHLGKWLAPGDDLTDRLVHEAAWWAIGALMLGYVLQVERLPLASIGLRRPDARTLGFGLLGALALFASVMLSYAVIFPLLGLHLNQATLGSIIHNPLWLQLLIFARAGVVEEILYRGYAIERIQQLTGRRWPAVLVSIAVFTLAHLEGWGGAQLIVVGFGAVILALLYVWRRDLLSNMLAHFLVDLVGFVVAAAQQK